jgi:hypothetical protein
MTLPTVNNQFITELKASLPLMTDLTATHRHYLLQYDYDELDDAVTYTLFDYTENRIYNGPLSFDKKTALTRYAFKILFNVYTKYFVSKNPLKLPAGIFDKLKDVWSHLFSLFIDPIATLLPSHTPCRIFTRWNVLIDGKSKLINIPALFDAFFRMDDVQGFDDVHFINVHHPSFRDFFNDYYKWKCPQAKDMHILYGLDEMLSVGNNSTAKGEEMRWHLFRKAFAAATYNGAKVEALSSKEILQRVFDRKHPGIVQVVSHFHYRRLYCAPTGDDIPYVRTIDIEHILQAKTRDGSLKDGIMLDGVTCNNYESLKPFLTSGISYIGFSFHNISTSIAAVMLYELYTGHWAISQGKPFPYLNGGNHLCEAWSKVHRTLNREMLNHKIINIPSYESINH